MKRVLFFVLLSFSSVVFSQTREEISEMTEEEFYDFTKVAIQSNPSENDLFKFFLREHAKRYKSGFVVGDDIYYSKKSSGVNIPMDAVLVKESSFASGNTDWITFDLETETKYYSITLNKGKYEIVSRFETDKQ
jgi:hypothetical protein